MEYLGLEDMGVFTAYGMETGAAGDTETIPAANTTESAGETGTVLNHIGSEPTAGEETIVKAEFDFERKTVMLNSGYEMPINGLGTYSLHGNVQ